MNPADPKVSIILPTYNGAKYIRQSIDSCLKQTYKNIELIVIDDCSTDNTPDIIKSYSDPRLRYIRNPKNLRLPRSLNAGFKQSTGEYLTWTSDDNEFLPTAIEEMMDYLKSHPQVDFVYTDLIVKNLETGETTARPLGFLNIENENNVGACYIYSRKVYETIGNYDPRFTWVEDYDYWIRIIKKFQVHHLNKALYLYGDHPGSLTRRKQYPIDMMRDLLKFYHGYFTAPEIILKLMYTSQKINKNLSTQERKSAWQSVRQVARNVPPRTLGAMILFCLSRIPFFVLNRLKRFIIKKGPEAISLDTIVNSAKLSSGKVNVLCIVPELVVGGSEKVMQDVVSGLTGNSYRFYLFCINKKRNAWCNHFISHFAKIFLVNGLNDFYSTDQAKYYEKLNDVIKKENIEIILLTNAQLAYLSLERLKKRFPHLKIIDIIHLDRVGGAKEDFIGMSPYLDQRICISDMVRQYILKLYQKYHMPSSLASKMEVIYNGIDLEHFAAVQTSAGRFRTQYKIAEDEKIITFIGRMAFEKKPFLFFYIARSLLASLPGEKLKFVMVGDGPYLPLIKRQVADSGLAPHFIFTGVLADVKPLLKETSVFLVTSEHEGIPLVLKEAMVMGVPVVSTNVGGIGELINDGHNGYLVNFDPNTVDAFTKKVSELILNPDVRRKFIDNSKQVIKTNFTYNKMIAHYKKVLSDL